MKIACHGCSDPEKTISKITTDLVTEVRKEIGVTCNKVDVKDVWQTMIIILRK